MPKSAAEDNHDTSALLSLQRPANARKVSFLDSVDRTLMIRIVIAIIRVRLWLIRQDYAATRVHIQKRLSGRAQSATLTEADLWKALRAGRIANGLGDRLPLDTRCLVRSLAVWWVLRQDGLPVDLKIGVSLQDGFAAHAWVDLFGEPLTDTRESLAHFKSFDRTSL